MATVTHYIYSHYEPQERKVPEQDIDQALDTEEIDPWQTESSFGARRRLAGAPRFVPAIVSYDEVNNMMGHPAVTTDTQETMPPNDVSNWYRSLTHSVSPRAGLDTASASVSPVSASQQSSSRAPRGLTAVGSGGRRQDRRANKDWFISRALGSEPSTASPTPIQTIADILSRDPPPSPSDKPYIPPVFLALGPSNKGFAMLQQSGWNEGEALGAGVVRRRLEKDERRSTKSVRRDPHCMTVKEEEHEVMWDEEGEVCEIRKADVIDLTLSDEEDEVEDLEPDTNQSSPSTSSADNNPTSSHNPKALLTPLPIVLKSDRLGIGLKAKTIGPYKASMKRVTHNAAALAAHIRSNEEMRRMKKLIGRGTKSFARQAKAESESRRQLLAHLNEG